MSFENQDKNIEVSINAILHQRRMQLPKIDKYIEGWQSIEHSLRELDTIISELRKHPKTPLELKNSLNSFYPQMLYQGIEKSILQLRIIQTRFSRATINIGVSGQARVGKSTLLQSISGLQDEQIPTGADIPVTAVRSRIYHHPQQQRATLSLHSFDSFRDDVLRPYHSLLGMNDLPYSIESFRVWNYPQAESLAEPFRSEHSSVTLLQRLQSMQRVLGTYQHLLVGGERQVPLSELRAYVAYPTNRDLNNENCPHMYLAVKDVRIECHFPYAQVNQLGIIDLPGLGELAANAEEHHLAGLQNDVDLVLLVKRPNQGMGYWGAQDGKAANLLDRARKFIKSRRDFVFIVINNGGLGADATTALRDNIRREANENQDNKNYVVLEADAASQQSVYDGVLTPALAHLVSRLPTMDKEVLEGTTAEHGVVLSQIRGALNDLASLLRDQIQTTGGSVSESLDDHVASLHETLASALAGLLESFEQKITGDTEDEDYLSALNAAYQKIDAWIESGFDKGGEESWCDYALLKMRRNASSGGFASDELNRIRVEISNRYHSLDILFSSRIEQLWQSIATILSENLGELVAGASDSQQTLKILSEKLAVCEGEASCPTLNKAVSDLLALRLEYRAHLHPRVRDNLDGLRYLTHDAQTGETQSSFVVEVSQDGAKQLFWRIRDAAEQSAYLIKKALVSEASLPLKVIYAAAEQFDDAFIRSGNSERELKRLARAYRDEIWPGVYKTLNEDNARFAKLRRAIESLQSQLNNFG